MQEQQKTEHKYNICSLRQHYWTHQKYYWENDPQDNISTTKWNGI